MEAPLDRWLKERGFVRGNPFAIVEADRERALLPRSFIEVPGYDHIKSPHTVIVFAPRGGGKSALRVVLASYAAPIAPEESTLAVEYTNFDSLLTNLASDKPLQISDHVQLLLRFAAQALLDALIGRPASDHLVADVADAHAVRAARALLITPVQRARLAHFLHTYHRGLLSPIELAERLHHLRPDLPSAPWLEFVQAVQDYRLRQAIAQGPLDTHPVAQLLADLNDFVASGQSSEATPTEGVRQFVALAHDIGFTQVTFLIDRVDESNLTANSPETQAALLEPLLAHLPILETPGASFKFFLSREARDAIWQRPTIRRDRLQDYEAVDIAWTPDKLTEMLTLRLRVYSQDRDGGEPYVHDLTEICQNVEVGVKIESAVTQLAAGSPRRLLLLCQKLCEIHTTTHGPKGLLTLEDWEKTHRTEDAIQSAVQPGGSLRLNLTRGIVTCGRRSLGLTGQQLIILRALVNAGGGPCSQSDLTQSVPDWDDYTSNNAIDKAMSKLRKVFNDVSPDSTHLVTQRGVGYRLINYEIEE